MSRVDESVRRILNLKYDLGLFENPFPENVNKTGNFENHEIAREAVRESLVLMKNNNNVLPLDQNATIVLAGSTSNIKRSLTGGWTYIWQHEDDSMFPDEMKTIQDALTDRLGENRVRIAQIEDINRKAREADVVVIATGENTALSEGNNNITDLDLSLEDRELIDAALNTGKPVVVILTEGRPRTFPDQVDAVDAILYAGLPGFFGAEIITEVLMGDVNPSGKLSFTYPYHQSFQINYDHRPTAFTFLHENDEGTERFSIGEFGEGLSYTTFQYEDLKLSGPVLKGELSTLTASVKVSNVGDRDGKESVLWFIRQEYGQITRPVKSLKFFEKKELTAGESKIFTFEIDPLNDLAYPDSNGNPILEYGEYTLMTGDLEVKFIYEE
jgi:beta-glucosidase